MTYTVVQGSFIIDVLHEYLGACGVNACLSFVVSREKRDWCSINYNVHASFSGQLPPPTVADAEQHS